VKNEKLAQGDFRSKDQGTKVTRC